MNPARIGLEISYPAENACECWRLNEKRKALLKMKKYKMNWTEESESSSWISR